MHFAHKRFLVQVDVAEEDGYLDFGETVQPYFKGNYITTDHYGNQSVMTESYFYEYYIGVRKLRKARTTQKSPFESEYAKCYLEMGELVKQSNENNDNYIFDVKK